MTTAASEGCFNYTIINTERWQNGSIVGITCRTLIFISAFINVYIILLGFFTIAINEEVHTFISKLWHCSIREVHMHTNVHCH